MSNPKEYKQRAASNGNSRIVVLTGGVFDLLHVGHLNYLMAAKELGDYLVVHVDGDSRVRTRKGPFRPTVGVRDRLKMVRALAPVDQVLTTEDDFCAPSVLRAVKPDIIVKVDRPERGAAETGQLQASINKILPGAKLVLVSPSPGVSTSDMMTQILDPLRKIKKLPPGLRPLKDVALAAALNGYSFSGLQIGAAVETSDGKVYIGCNISNSSPGLAMCAERMAILNAVADGAKSITRLVLFASSRQLITPCGLCRQTLNEFASPDNPTEIYIANLDTTYVSSIDKLLPKAFLTPRKPGR